jgi:flagellar motor switch protein FliN/FliY
VAAAFDRQANRVEGLPNLETMKVDVKVVLGTRLMPVHMLLRMGRGAVIELDQSDNDMVVIYANDHPVARGQIVVTGTRIQVEITEIIPKPTMATEKGTSLGDGAIAALAAVDPQIKDGFVGG